MDGNPAGRLPSHGWHRNPFSSGEVLTRHGFPALHDLVRRTDGYDLAPVLSCAGSDIYNAVRRQHGVFVMLHHQDGIPQVPQTLQCGQQLVIVPLVQADAGLIQDIGHAHQAGTDLGGQTDSLGLAAGQCSRSSGQGQVIQTHIDEKAHPGPDFLQDRGADGLLHGGKLQSVDKLPELYHAHVGGIVDVQASDGYRKGPFLQALSAAGRTGRDLHEGFHLRLAGL